MSILMQEGRVYTDDDFKLMLAELEEREHRETQFSFWVLIKRMFTWF